MREIELKEVRAVDYVIESAVAASGMVGRRTSKDLLCSLLGLPVRQQLTGDYADERALWDGL